MVLVSVALYPESGFVPFWAVLLIVKNGVTLLPLELLRLKFTVFTPCESLTEALRVNVPEMLRRLVVVLTSGWNSVAFGALRSMTIFSRIALRL